MPLEKQNLLDIFQQLLEVAFKLQGLGKTITFTQTAEQWTNKV